MTREILQDLEEMLQAQKLVLERCERQLRTRDAIIRRLMELAGEYNAPTLKIAAAVAPLFQEPLGPVPTAEMDPTESTAPMDRDADRREVEEHKRADHIKTLELPTLAKLGLGGAA